MIRSFVRLFLLFCCLFLDAPASIDAEENREALPWYQQAAQIFKQALGEDHPSYATSLNNLAG